MSCRVNDGILISAVRYALGRRTYIVGNTVGEVMRNLENMQRKTLRTLRDDISHAKSYGDDMDYKKWMELLEAIKKQLGGSRI